MFDIPEAVMAVVEPIGFVIDQFSVTLQLLDPDEIEQLPEELIPPDIILFSLQAVFVPPLTPLHVQVQVDVLFELFTLVPVLQL
jgi:hypothetical protein